jgi:uncharacterized HAD superfamily protein
MNAALISGIPPELAVENMRRAIDQAKPVQAFLSQLSRPRVVCDIDGTLAERDVATCLVLNAKFNTDYRYADIRSPNAEDWIKEPRVQQWWERYHHDPRFLSNLTPYQDAMWALWSLRSGGYHVTIASDREAALEAVSVAWLKTWGIDYDDVRIGDDQKLAIAQDASPTEPVVFFDDNPARAADLPGPGRTVLLLDRPWNRGVEESANVHRIQTWPQGLDYLPAQDSFSPRSLVRSGNAR